MKIDNGFRLFLSLVCIFSSLMLVIKPFHEYVSALILVAIAGVFFMRVWYDEWRKGV